MCFCFDLAGLPPLSLSLPQSCDVKCWEGKKKSSLYFLCGGGRRGDTISTDISWIICPKLILYSDLVGAKKC